MLKVSVRGLNSLHEQVLVSAVGKNLIHCFLEEQASDLASLSRVGLLNKRIDVISKHLLLISVSLAHQLIGVNVYERNNLSRKRLTEELALCHLIDSADVSSLLRDLEL